MNLRSAVCAVAAVLIAVSFILNVPKLQATRNALELREQAAHEMLLNGETVLRLQPVTGSGSRFDSFQTAPDIINDPTFWVNVALARYFGAETVLDANA